MTDDGFGSFVADSVNWCCGPLLVASLSFAAGTSPADAWSSLWEDRAVSGPWEDTALTRNVPITPAVVWSYSRDSTGPTDPLFSLEKPPLRCGILRTSAGRLGFKAYLGAPWGAPRPYDGRNGFVLDILFPPKMVARVAPLRWEGGRDDQATKGLFEGALDLLRRIRGKTPFRTASLADEDFGLSPELHATATEGAIIVEPGFADGADLIDASSLEKESA